MGEFLALLSLLFFSSNALLVSVLTPRLGQELGFLIALAGNVVFSGVAVIAVAAATSDWPRMNWAAALLFAVGGLFTTYLGRRMFFRSVQTIGPSRASSLLITNPLFAGLISWVFLGEALGPFALVAIALVVAGLYLTTQVPTGPPQVAVAGQALPAPGRPDAAPGGRGFARLPRREIGLALAGALAFGLGNFLRSAGVREWNEPILGAFIGSLAGTLAYLILHTDVGTLVRRVREADPWGVRLWLLSGFLTISAQVALIASTRHLEIAVAVVVSTALPIIVIPASVVLLRNREAVTPRTAAGGLLILSGVAGLLLL